VVFRFDEPERATAVLQGKGLKVLDERQVLGST
jgi:hypothetical protein